MGFFDFLIKPLSSFLDIISFGKLDGEKFINDAIGIALGVTKISTIVDVAQTAVGVEILPPSITKTKALGKLTDDLGLGGTIIGKAVHIQEDIALANILKDKVKTAVKAKKSEWLDELKGKQFHDASEIQAEINRKIEEEKKRQETIIKINTMVEDLTKTKSTAFMVVNTSILDAPVKKAYEDMKKKEGEKLLAERISLEKEKEDKRYTEDKQRFVNDFIIGKKKVEAGRMGWFNQMKQYYKV